jgi:autotransporter-associated beta strand protein
VAPDLSGDNLFFDGMTNTAPLENQGYTVSGLTFNSTAGSFNIGPATQTLNLTGGITNNSANTQMINVGVSADYSPVTIDAAAADLVFAQAIDISGPLTVTDGKHNTVIEGPITDVTTSGSTWIMAGTGTNTLLGTNTYAGNTSINSGTLAIGLTGQLGASFGAPPLYAGNITNNGTLLYNSTNVQALSGIISGSGSLDVIGLAPYTGTNTANTLVLSGASTFTNNVIISNAYVSDTYGPNGAGGATALGVANLAGRTVTINSNGVLSIDVGNAFTGGGTAVALGFIINQGGVMQATMANSAIGPVTLNGGVLQLVGLVNSGALQYQPFELSGSVTVGGTYPSLMTNIGNASGGFNLTVGTGGSSQTLFNVASTGAAGPDLTVALPLGNSGGTGNSAGLIKAGPGTMALTGSNIYTGVTTLSNGILNLGVADTPGTAGP